MGTALFILFAVWYLIINNLLPGDNSYKDEIDFLNHKADLKVLLYGDDIVLPEGFEYRKINNLDEEAISCDSEFVYLIINDLGGKAEMSEEEFASVYRYFEEHPNFNFYYLGTDRLEMIDKIIPEYESQVLDTSFGYETCEGERQMIIVLPRDYEPYEISDRILFCMTRAIRTTKNIPEDQIYKD